MCEENGKKRLLDEELEIVSGGTDSEDVPGEELPSPRALCPRCGKVLRLDASGRTIQCPCRGVVM